MKTKTYIQPKAFYAEAEEMQTGWGKYLRNIDILKDKVAQRKNITLREACWIMYGEGHTSSYWEAFKTYCEKMKWNRRKMPWEAWKGLATTMPSELSHNKGYEHIES